MTPSTAKTISNLQATINKLDPANKQVAFIGWGTTDASQRVSTMEKYITDNFSLSPKPIFGHYHSGPRDNRKITSTSYAEFATEQARDDFLKAVESRTFPALVVNEKDITQGLSFRDRGIGPCGRRRS